ncbi:MAG TPA: alanyl-tRNA editing protein [Acetobacteraceae bacterium]|nr:alanyl-tRNA editing protein [Acetobacteraceae bacterium]
MTERLFLADAMLREATATVLESGPDCIVLDRTPFYARAGGQPGDGGVLRWHGGEMPVSEAVKGEGEAIRHVPAADATLPPSGATVAAVIDWSRRWAHMRMHTSLHLLCAVLPGAAVTGGQIGADRSRLDFDLPDPPSREAIEAGLNALIAADHPVTAEWVEESVLDDNPGLVRTLSVKPPRGTGRLRLVRIGAGATPIDLQPCGGTHVPRTGAIGAVRLLKMESKGRQNRRIVLALADGGAP